MNVATWEMTYRSDALPEQAVVAFDASGPVEATTEWASDGVVRIRVLDAPVMPNVVRFAAWGPGDARTAITWQRRLLEGDGFYALPAVVAPLMRPDPGALGSPAWVEEQLRGLRGEE